MNNSNKLDLKEAIEKVSDFWWDHGWNFVSKIATNQAFLKRFYKIKLLLEVFFKNCLKYEKSHLKPSAFFEHSTFELKKLDWSLKKKTKRQIN